MHRHWFSCYNAFIICSAFTSFWLIILQQVSISAVNLLDGQISIILVRPRTLADDRNRVQGRNFVLQKYNHKRAGALPIFFIPRCSYGWVGESIITGKHCPQNFARLLSDSGRLGLSSKGDVASYFPPRTTGNWQVMFWKQSWGEGVSKNNSTCENAVARIGRIQVTSSPRCWCVF